MALVGVELETLVSEPDALTTQPIPQGSRLLNAKEYVEPPAFNAEKVRTFVP